MLPWLLGCCALPGEQRPHLVLLGSLQQPCDGGPHKPCADSPSQRRGMRPRLSISLLQVHPNQPYLTQQRCFLRFLGPEPFSGKAILPPPRIPPHIGGKVSDGLQVPVSVRCVLAKNQESWDTRDGNGRITSRVGHCSRHLPGYYGARFLACFFMVTFLIFTFPPGSPS